MSAPTVHTADHEPSGSNLVACEPTDAPAKEDVVVVHTPGKRGLRTGLRAGVTVNMTD